jgi:hypothetical protein
MNIFATIVKKVLGLFKNQIANLVYFLVMNLSKYSSCKKIKVLDNVVPFVPTTPRNINKIPEGLKTNFNKKFGFKTKYIYFLSSSFVSYYGVVFKNFRLFIPSLVHPKWNVQVISSLRTNVVSFLLQQWSANVIHISNTKSKPVAIIYELWSSTNYYHWICDSLPRLLLLKKNNIECTILLPNPTPDYVKQTIKWFGFNNIIEIEKDSIYKIDNIIVPDLTAAIAAQNESLMKEVRKALLSKYNIINSRPSSNTISIHRVYSSRKSARFRKVDNESAVINLLEKYNFIIVDFDNYSFLDQLELMSNSNFLIGVHGANLTNMMFMQEESVIIEIMNKEVFNPCYYHLSSGLNMKYNYLPCLPISKIAHDNNDDLYVDLAVLEDLVLANINASKLVAVNANQL